MKEKSQWKEAQFWADAINFSTKYRHRLVSELELPYLRVQGRKHIHMSHSQAMN